MGLEELRHITILVEGRLLDMHLAVPEEEWAERAQHMLRMLLEP